MQNPASPKDQLKHLVKIKAAADLRQKALKSESLQCFNLELLGLTDKPHAVIVCNNNNFLYNALVVRCR